jgi:hypothetical protein
MCFAYTFREVKYVNRVYMISVVKADDHVEARFSPYNITITADTYEHAIELMRECIIGEGTKRKDFDPDDVSDKSDTDCGQAFLWIDMEREYKIRNTSSVRKNITLPEWMDTTLRELGVDASKLFQDAAIKFIMESERSENITSVEELEKRVPKDILDQYIIKRVKGE